MEISLKLDAASFSFEKSKGVLQYKHDTVQVWDDSDPTESITDRVTCT
jgi:hypothetical protein